MNYSDYQAQVSSEKLTLAIVYASKRLMAWTVHSGSVYKLSNFDVSSIVSLSDSGTDYTEVTSIAAITTSSFYNDRENKILYLKATGSVNPNSKFLVLTFKLFYSNIPVTLPDDLEIGPEVYWEPMLKSTSVFGVEIDTINQTSEAIEGSGTLTLYNDQEFWPANYDKLTFENKPVYIYSYHKDIDILEKVLLFKGLIEKKSYSGQQIQFSLRDQLSELRAPITLSNIEDLALRTSENLAKAKQRMILGQVYGHRLVNLDEVLDGYPLTGTVSVTSGAVALTGSGTTFLADLSPDDILVLNGVDYTVGPIASNTALTLTSAYSDPASLSGATYTVKPALPKRTMNRSWLVSGHAVREPTTTTMSGSSITRLLVDSTEDIFSGDWLYVGTLGAGELVLVDEVLGSNLITLSTSLVSDPALGTTVTRPAVQNVRIDDNLLVYDQDYSFDASTGILSLDPDAEKNSAPLKQMSNILNFTSTSRTVTGTALTSLVSPGSLVGAVGHTDLFEVLSVDSETSLTLRTASTFTDNSNKGLYKTFVLDPDSSVVTCDVLGRTDDGTSSGNLLDTAPAIVYQMLIDLGFETSTDSDSFIQSEQLAYEKVGLVIPSSYDDTSIPTYREVFNQINQSVFGSLIQNYEFKFSYLVLQPNKSIDSIRLDEADILSFSVASAADKIIKTAIVEYRPLEYNYLTKTATLSTQQKTSDTATYILNTQRTRTFKSVVVNTSDAERYANRWAFILENSSSVIKLKTKLQGATIQVGDIVEIDHRKLYERMGSDFTRKLGLVESSKKNGSFVELTVVDLSNAFNRCASINDLTTSWSDTDEDGRLYGGFITDQYGIIDDDPDSFGANLIW